MKLMLLWLSSLTSNTPVARKSYKPMNKKLMLGNMRQILQGCFTGFRNALSIPWFLVWISKAVWQDQDSTLTVLDHTCSK